MQVMEDEHGQQQLIEAAWQPQDGATAHTQQG